MMVLLLNGSPKRGKNDACCMTRAFLDGMNSVSNTKLNTYMDVMARNIQYCKECSGGIFPELMGEMAVPMIP